MVSRQFASACSLGEGWSTSILYNGQRRCGIQLQTPVTSNLDYRLSRGYETTSIKIILFPVAGLKLVVRDVQRYYAQSASVLLCGNQRTFSDMPGARRDRMGKAHKGGTSDRQREASLEQVSLYHLFIISSSSSFLTLFKKGFQCQCAASHFRRTRKDRGACLAARACCKLVGSTCQSSLGPPTPLLRVMSKSWRGDPLEVSFLFQHLTSASTRQRVKMDWTSILNRVLGGFLYHQNHQYIIDSHSPPQFSLLFFCFKKKIIKKKGCLADLGRHTSAGRLQLLC